MEGSVAATVRAAADGRERRLSTPVIVGLAGWASRTASVLLVRGFAAPQGAVVLPEGPGILVIAAGGHASFVLAGREPVPGARLLDVVVSTSPEAVRAALGALADVGDEPVASAAADALAAVADDPGESHVDAVVDGLVAALDAERRTVAEALHDGPVQDLTAAQLLLDSALWAGPALPNAVKQPMDGGLASLLSGIGGCRAMMVSLAEPVAQHVSGPDGHGNA